MRGAARVVVEARAKLNLALAVGPRRADGVDPDIADIVPGPQPHPFLDDEELEEQQ